MFGDHKNVYEKSDISQTTFLQIFWSDAVMQIKNQSDHTLDFKNLKKKNQKSTID